VASKLDSLTQELGDLPSEVVPAPAAPLDPRKPTAVLLVGGYGGLGIHSLLTLFRMLPNYFRR
jgi:hypothetical protein